MKDTVNLDDLISQYRISMETRRVASSPMPTDEDLAGEVEHYKCKLYRPGKEVEIYLAARAADGHLTISDVLYMLAMDSSACRMLEGYEGPAREWTSVFGGSADNVKEFEEFWQEYRWRCRQNEEVKAFLGDKIYEQLVRRLEPY